MTTRLTPSPATDGSLPDVRGSEPGLPHRIGRLPILILYPHSRCNCRCAMCDIWRVTTNDQLDPQAVARSAASWRALGVERVVLSGGEPLMHRGLWSLVEPLVDEGIGVTLLTTGLLLRRHATNVARFVDDVVVSLDGPPEVHDEIRRVPAAFARLAEGVSALREAAADAGRRVAISARCTVQSANCLQLRATVRSAQDLGLDRISFLPVDVSSEAFNRPGGWPQETRAAVAPGPELGRAVDAEIELLIREYSAEIAAGFVAESPDKLRRLARYFRALRGEEEFPPVECNAPWVSAVVEADGTVRPCFFHRPIGQWTGGDLNEELNSSDAVGFRRSLDVASNPVCRRCVCSLNLAVGGAANQELAGGPSAADSGAHP